MQSLSVEYILHSIIFVRNQHAALLVEYRFEVFAGIDGLRLCFLHGGSCLQSSIVLMESVDVILFAGYHSACRKERFGRTHSSVELNAYISGIRLFLRNTFQLHRDGFARSTACTELVGIDFFSMIADDVVVIVFIQIGKTKIIAHIYRSGFFLEIDELDILIYLAHFRGLRFYRTVGIDNAVDAEITVGWSTDCTVIAAIRPILAAICRFLGKSLIHPIPDATTLQKRVFLDNIPVFLEIA